MGRNTAPTIHATNLLVAKRQDILRIAAEHHVASIRLFGSVARNEATPESDFDFLVTFEPGYTLWDHIGLIQSLTDLLGRPVDVTTESGLKPRLRERVLAEAIPLYRR